MLSLTMNGLIVVAYALAGYSIAVTAAYIGLCKRHGNCKATLARVRGERQGLRDKAWERVTVTSFNPDIRPALGDPVERAPGVPPMAPIRFTGGDYPVRRSR